MSATVSVSAAPSGREEPTTQGVGPRILVVDPEEPPRRSLCAALAARGYRVDGAATGGAALANAGDLRPDLIILEIVLPDADGLDVIRRLREWSSTPIVILSGCDLDARKIAALDAGADDYLTKPFNTGELLARLRTALRHTARGSTDPVITTGALTVDIARRRVTIGARAIALPPVEYTLLKTLALSAGTVFDHRRLLRTVWGVEHETNTNLLRVSMSKLRRKLESDPARPEYILTVPCVGYRLREPD